MRRESPLDGITVQTAAARDDVNAARYLRPSLSQVKADLGVSPDDQLDIEDIATYVAGQIEPDGGQLIPALPFRFSVTKTADDTEVRGGRRARSAAFRVARTDTDEEILVTVYLQIVTADSPSLETVRVGFSQPDAGVATETLYLG